jgi:hypothetical protein
MSAICKSAYFNVYIVHTYIQTTHALSSKGYQRYIRYSSETPTLHQNYLAMINTVDVTGSKPIAVRSQSGVNAINPLVAFYDIHGRKREVLFCFGHHTRLYYEFI